MVHCLITVLYDKFAPAKLDIKAELGNNVLKKFRVAVPIYRYAITSSAYVYHQSLWAPIGMHWAWNYLEGYVFGCPVSGAFIQHLIIMSRLVGPTWLTGGSFGPEASVIAILIGVAISLYYTLKLKQKRRNQTTA